MQAYLTNVAKHITYVYNIITYIGYKMIHPLENKLLISIQIKKGEDGENGENYTILKENSPCNFCYSKSLFFFLISCCK